MAAHDAISDNVTIPTIPEVVLRINQLTQDPDAGMRELGELVAEDAPLSSKVLRIANSSFYGLRQRVMSTEHATAVLGARALRNIVLQASVIQQYEHLHGQDGVDLTQLWRHSILCAQLSRRLVGRVSARIDLAPEEVYTCGLLHDIGKVVLLDCMTDRYLEAVADSRRRGVPLHESEAHVLGFDHTEVGALIAERWGLPEGVARSIRKHHADAATIEQDTQVALIHVANTVAAAVARDEELAADDLVTPGIRRALGLDELLLEEIVETAREAWAEIEV